MKKDKKELFTKIVSRIYRKSYPSLLKKFKNDDFFLDKIPVVFDTAKKIPINTSAYSSDNDKEHDIEESHLCTATFMPSSNIICVHLEQTYQCAKSYLNNSPKVLKIYSIEDIMHTIIIGNVIHELMHYHQFVDTEFTDVSMYTAECEAESAAVEFKIRNYPYLLNIIGCIPKVLFGDAPHELFSKITGIGKDRLNSEIVADLAKEYIKEENIGLIYMPYRKTDEINLVSRYVYSSYSVRLAMKNLRTDEEGPIYISHIENDNEIRDVLKKIDEYRDNVKYIEMKNKINWNDAFGIINFPIIGKVVTLPISSSECKLKPNNDEYYYYLDRCREVSVFLNSLVWTLNLTLDFNDRKLKEMDDRELYKALTNKKQILPLSYALLLDFIKLDVSADNDTLIVEAKLLDIKRAKYEEPRLSLTLGKF